MLYNFLLVLIILDGLVLAIAVLLQAGTGGGLASMGGGSTDMVLGGRQAVTILHKTSWVTGTAFMVLALVLSITASRRSVGQSDVQRQLRQQPPVQQPVPPAPLQVQPPAAIPPAAPPPAPPTGKQP